MRAGLHDLAQSAATDGQIPAWDDASGLWVPVDPPSGGGSDPTTTKGDLIVNDGSGLDRLPVGTDGQILYADSGEPLGVKWDDAPSGGGGVASFPLDPSSLHATYGDHFTGASLAAKWTRAGSFVSGDETYQQGGGTWLQSATRGSGSYYYQAFTNPGDFVLEMSAVYLSASAIMFGLIVTDNTGAGVAGGWYAGSPNGPITAQLNTSVAYDGSHFSSPPASTGPQGSLVIAGGQRVWYRLVRSGNTWKTALSLNGNVWSPYTSTLTVTFTPTRIGFGTFFGSPSVAVGGMAIDFFDVQ